jgi:hypothetical protein
MGRAQGYGRDQGGEQKQSGYTDKNDFSPDVPGIFCGDMAVFEMHGFGFKF